MRVSYNENCRELTLANEKERVWGMTPFFDLFFQTACMQRQVSNLMHANNFAVRIENWSQYTASVVKRLLVQIVRRFA
jgi:hypothetical protein